MADPAKGTNIADPANENIDENFQTVEKEDSSTDMLTCLSQEYECSEQQGLPIDDRVQSFLQKLIWGVHKQEKLDLVLQNTLIIPSNISRDYVLKKINPEIWGKIGHDKKSFDLKLQSMQSLLLKTMNILTVSTDTLYKGRNLDQAAIQTLVKDTIRNCADMMMLLGKINFQLLSRRRECIVPELNFNFKALNFVPGDHPKLLFGDDLMKSVKDITENNKVEQAILKKPYYSSTISKNPNNTRYTGKTT